MHAPRHVMFTPVEHVLAHLLGFLIVEGIFERLVGFEIPFEGEGFDLDGHGNNLLVIRRLGAPLSLLLEPIILEHGGGHEGFVGETDELAIKVVVVVALDVRLEVVATNDMIGFEEEPNRVVDVGTVSEQLRIILVQLAIDLVDTAIDRGSKYP